MIILSIALSLFSFAIVLVMIIIVAPTEIREVRQRKRGWKDELKIDVKNLKTDMIEVYQCLDRTALRTGIYKEMTAQSMLLQAQIDAINKKINSPTGETK